MILSTLAGTAILGQDGVFEPQRKSNFALIIPNTGGDTLVLGLKTVRIPGIDTVQQTIKFFNDSAHYIGAKAKTENLTLSFHDYLDAQVLDELSFWFRQGYNPATGAIGRAADYKRRGILLLLPPGMEPREAPGAVQTQAYRNRAWVCRGLYVKKLAPTEFDHEDEGTPAMIDVEMSCDNCYPQILER